MTNTTKEAPDNIDWTEGQSLIDFFNGSLEVRTDTIHAMLAAAREEGALAMQKAAAFEASKRAGSYGKAREITEAIRAIDPKEVTK